MSYSQACILCNIIKSLFILLSLIACLGIYFLNKIHGKLEPVSG